MTITFPNCLPSHWDSHLDVTLVVYNYENIIFIDSLNSYILHINVLVLQSKIGSIIERPTLTLNFGILFKSLAL